MKNQEQASRECIVACGNDSLEDIGSHLPLVSVIIPSFNHAQYIDEAIESVFAQDYENWEIIVSDDGSRDNTHDVLEKYRSDSRMTLLLNKINRGQGHVLNDAIDIAKGDFICILSSDDIYMPKKLGLQIEKFRHSDEKVGFVYSYGSSLDDDTGKIEPDYWPFFTGDIFRQLIRQQNFIYPISPMFRRSVFDRERFWDGFVAEGEAFYVRAARHFHAEFVDEITCAMRRHTYNIGANVDRMYIDNLAWWTRFAALPDLPSDVGPLVSKRIAWLHRLKGLEYVRLTREYRKGRGALLLALRANPVYALDWKVWAGLVIATIAGAFPTKALGSASNE